MTQQDIYAQELVINKLKLIIALKSSGATDRDICRAIDITMPLYLRVLENDEYIREKIENAEMSYAMELETKFKAVTMKKLDEGDTTDAKWILERTVDKYKKTEKVDITVRTIDDIIRSIDMGEALLDDK